MPAGGRTRSQDPARPRSRRSASSARGCPRGHRRTQPRGRRMIEGIRQYLDHRGALGMARDLLDVLIVYYVVYRALLVLRGTRAMQVGVGLGVVFVLYIVAQLFQLVTVLTILGALISSSILLIVVVFQNDIRRGLQRVGSRAWFSSFARSQESKVIDEVVDAATDLARHRI